MKRRYAALAMPVVAGVAAAGWWWASWGSPVPVIARARQAFGTGPEVHVVATLDVDPGAPAMRPITSDEGIEVWYDERRGTHAVLRKGTAVKVDRVESLLPPYIPPVPEATGLYEFITSYLPDLAARRYRSCSSSSVQGRRVIWLCEPDAYEAVNVAIDPVSYQPLWLRAPDADVLTQLSVAETKPYDPADFLTAKQKKPRHL